jgi:hypothetical protein
LSAPILAVGDGALGFWAALREVVPDYGAKWPKAIAKITLKDCAEPSSCRDTLFQG